MFFPSSNVAFSTKRINIPCVISALDSMAKGNMKHLQGQFGDELSPSQLKKMTKHGFGESDIERFLRSQPSTASNESEEEKSERLKKLQEI